MRVKWQVRLTSRVLLNAFVGALLTSLVAAFCGGAVSAMARRLISAAYAISTPLLSTTPDGILMTSTFATTAACAGFVMGCLIFGIAAVKARPGNTFEPMRALIGRVALGLVAGTLGFCSLFLVVEFARSQLTGQLFPFLAMNDLRWLFIGTIALMICGAIAGALSKRTT